MMCRSSVVLAMVLASACTRDNPAFDEGTGSASEDGPTSGVDPTSGVVSTSGVDPTSGPGPTSGDTSGDGGTTKATDGPADTTSTAEDSTSATTIADTGPLPTACMFPEPYGIVFGDPGVLGPCDGLSSAGVVPLDRPPLGDSFEARVCDGCPCLPKLGPETTVTFEGFVPTMLPECFLVDIEREPSCEVLAYTISIPLVGLLAAASNVVDPSLPDEPFGFVLADQPTEACESECVEGSGSYALLSSIPGAPAVPPDPGASVQVTAGLHQYEVVNEGSGIDGRPENAGACVEVGRWHAMRSF